ncbi:predicted protein [Uncinocarpus reesii 1704]|uniref:Nonribosomal peptide synthetase uncD n=1 Tax=Uncinocarpus reesii (strain UAMH 1704) TaxID=336963 RepID=UNCD_UNCRE|nr:uncharacterized protein UREG_02297 [Uncinocarpus reesii 1704]EEP77448.1 predicted protein [Uncinocarpus reesii 1704]
MPLIHDTSAQERITKQWRSLLHDFKPCHFPGLPDGSTTDTKEFQETTAELNINELSIQHSCTQYHVEPRNVFQTAWAIVINCYAGVEDVSFGYDTTGDDASAPATASENILLCRTHIDAENQLGQTALEMKRSFDDAWENRNWSISEIQKLVGSENQPLFNSGLQVQREGRQSRELKEIDILARILIKDDTSLAVSVRTRTAKFSAMQTADVAHTFAKTLLESIKAHPESRIGDLDICSQRDYEKVMNWNKAVPSSVDNTFHEHFESIAQKTPDAPAICSWDGNFTYQELDSSSTRLANHLADLGVVPETLVLLCFNKSAFAIVSMLGIMKAGGAFVAIDPSYPASRIQAILQATNAEVVVTEPEHRPLFEGTMKHIVAIGPELAEELPATPKTIGTKSSPSNTAYVVFTSGSTGAPKGIMVEHRALCTAAVSLSTPMRIDSTTRHLNFAAFTFDLSYGDIFVTLSQGACLCLPSECEKVNDLAGAMVRMNVNSACLIPSVVRVFQPEDVPGLKTLSLGGEALVKENLELWAPKVVLNNMGYLDGEQTKRSFVENPSWAKVEPGQRRRFYKTGDLVKYNSDGTVGFIGRKDTQVKFHGRRVETGEIEYHLACHDSLRQSVVILPSAGVYSKRLVAVVVLKTNQMSQESASELKVVTGIAKEKSASEVAKVKKFLSSRVPHYMVPQFWIVVEQIPLMISGKMNRVLARRFLESLDEDNLETKVNGSMTVQKPDDPVELHLRKLCSHVLNKDMDKIDAEQTWEDLGGDSMSAMELIARCRAENLVLTMHDFLDGNTVRQMASIAKRRTPGTPTNGHRAQETPRMQGGCGVQARLKFPPVWWE